MFPIIDHYLINATKHNKNIKKLQAAFKKITDIYHRNVNEIANAIKSAAVCGEWMLEDSLFPYHPQREKIQITSHRYHLRIKIAENYELKKTK